MLRRPSEPAALIGTYTRKSVVLVLVLADTSPAAGDHADATKLDYCERSAKHTFGAATGDAEADKILGALATGPKTLSEMHRVFANNRSSDWLLAKLAMLVRAGKAEQTSKRIDRKGSIPAWKLNIS